jgi:hypothetical protein
MTDLALPLTIGVVGLGAVVALFVHEARETRRLRAAAHEWAERVRERDRLEREELRDACAMVCVGEEQR